MSVIHLSNGQEVKVKVDHDKLVRHIVKNETIEIKGVTYFTKHVIDVAPDKE